MRDYLGPDVERIEPVTVNVSMLAEEQDEEALKRRLIHYLEPEPGMRVLVKEMCVSTEPNLRVFQVEVEDGRGGCWHEAFNSEAELRAFFRGIRITFAMSSLQRLLPDFLPSQGRDRAGLVFAPESLVQSLNEAGA